HGADGAVAIDRAEEAVVEVGDVDQPVGADRDVDRVVEARGVAAAVLLARRRRAGERADAVGEGGRTAAAVHVPAAAHRAARGEAAGDDCDACRSGSHTNHLVVFRGAQALLATPTGKARAGPRCATPAAPR